MDNGKNLILALSDKRIYNISLVNLIKREYDVVESDNLNGELRFRETDRKVDLGGRMFLGGDRYFARGLTKNRNLDSKVFEYFKKFLEKVPEGTEIVLFYSNKSVDTKEWKELVEVHYYSALTLL